MDRVVVQWETPSVTPVIRQGPGGDAVLEVRAGSWPLIDAAGQLRLPYTSTLVALPPQGMPDLAVHLVPGASVPCLSCAEMDVVLEDGAPLPAVTLTEVGTIRGLRLARLTFNPVRRDAVDDPLDVAAGVTITLTFGITPSASTLSLKPDDPLRARVATSVVNPNHVGRFARSSAVQSSASTLQDAPAWQLRLREPGLYALDWDLLVSAGVVPEDGDASRVHLIRGATGRAVAMRWKPAERRFLFYADPVPTRWADHEVYRLAYRSTPGLRMVSRPGSPADLDAGELRASVLIEENHRYDSLYASPRDGDRWYWSCLRTDATYACPASGAYTLTLQSPQPQGTATLRVWLQGRTPSAKADLRLNGQSLSSVTWTGKTAYTATVDVPASRLKEGENQLTLAARGAGTWFWVDAVDLTYPVDGAIRTPVRVTGESMPRAYAMQALSSGTRVYDVTDPDRPMRVQDAVYADGTLAWGDDREGPRRYLLAEPGAVRRVTALEPVALLNDPVGADVLVVAPEVFLPPMAPWIAHRRSQGYRVSAAPLQAIYDTFGDGRVSPEAIRAFVSHAYHTGVPQPLYLLLVGDGTWDPLDHIDGGNESWLPPYLAPVDPFLQEVPADNRYAAVDGDDALPDLLVGRMPVNQVADVRAMVAKTLAYETDPFPGDWNQRHLFVVDDPDPAGDFPAMTESVLPSVPISHTSTLIRAPDSSETSPDALREPKARLLNAWDAGALVINWTGHSAWQQWEHRRLFHTDDLPTLQNGRRLPLVVEMTCFTGNFAHPDPLQTSLDEALVRLPDGGAVAAWGSSGGGISRGHGVLHRSLYETLNAGEDATLGLLTTAAKFALLSTPDGYLMDTYHLFGDPTLPLNLTDTPWVSQTYLPCVRR